MTANKPPFPTSPDWVWRGLALSLLLFGLAWSGPASAQQGDAASPQAASPQAVENAEDAPAAVEAATPLLRLAETEFDNGEASPGTTVTHDFVIKNEGQAPLLISDVIPGCGCTVTSFTSFIPPGGQGKVGMAVDLYKEWAGRNVNKAATIISNDPNNPTVRIIMRARVTGAQAQL
jgi:hypothetical protein